MQISLIVAMSENNMIGAGGDLPWRLSADLRRFKKLTMGHHIVMGRKTYESIGRPLPGRTMVVISRKSDYQAEFGHVVHSVNAALEFARTAGDDEVFVIGGGEIYRQALPLVDRVYLTRVHAEVEGDTVFPAVDFANWTLVEKEECDADGKNQFAHSFCIYNRRNTS